MTGSAKTRLAVMASGTGTNFVAITRAAQEGSIDADVCMLLCDKPGAPVLERAAELGIPAVAINPRDFPDKAAYEERLLRHLREADADLIALAGYMRVVGPTLLNEYEGRMLNVHPSLLPHFTGLNALERSFEGGNGGATVHLIDAGLDTGPVLVQKPVERLAEDTLDSFAARVHAIEHTLFPLAIQQVIEARREEPK